MKYETDCPYLGGTGSLVAKFELVPWMGKLSLASSGEDSPLDTRFKCFRDDDRLSFLFDCEDTYISATMKAPNSRVWLEDAVELFIAPGSEDPQSYYEFQLSPANVTRQVKVITPQDGKKDFTFDDSWRCDGLITETYIHGYLNDRSRESKGWQGIVSLPLKSLAVPGRTVRSGEAWRMNLFRIDRWPADMFSAWSPTFYDPPLFHSPKHFGYLIFT